MRLTTILVAAACAVLVACTTNPYTGEQQASKTATYGLGAAAVCGLVGAMDSAKKARNAALGCGIVGAGVGAYMDVQEKKLREQLQGTGVRVVREGDNIRLVMPGNITFNTDSYQLRADFYPVLNSVGLVLAKYADTTIRITGHTDNRGSRQYNLTLSEKRADSVANYLVTRDVARGRMYIEGAAFDQPVADNGTAAGRAENRRVELYILPKTT
ncbi:MAG: OmpA family protein [Halieaceae bacterium]|nr:OmpA family protein [Halieaceae bacterium]MCP5146530.1 OmpA family protein [Pseudomonadales bacterium]MCP5166434.1 OmpA family protein [Pseudomonadales bacterium]MCP5186328.1 OmpA family protein [Pseudomonadales bacterium]